MEKGDAGGPLIKWRVKSEKMVSGSIAFFVVRTEYELDKNSGFMTVIFLLAWHNVFDILAFMNVFIYER